MHYRLLVLGYSRDYLPLFTELEPLIHYISPFWKNTRELAFFLSRMHFSRSPILPQIEKFTEISEQAPCYLFFRDWYPLFVSGFIQKVKEHTPLTKTCWFFSDLVKSYPKINIEKMKREFDLILSFDPEDAKRYGFIYCPLPYSIIPKEAALQKEPVTHDVFFSGQAKQRLSEILHVFEKLRNEGLSLDFHIANAPSIERRFEKEIDYSPFKPYSECLEGTLSSSCILELLQEPDHHGFTARTAEALVYGRKLISNNQSLVNAPFYDPKQIHIFSDPNDIDLNFITESWEIVPTSAFFSPLKTLRLIEQQLNITFTL